MVIATCIGMIDKWIQQMVQQSWSVKTPFWAGCRYVRTCIFLLKHAWHAVPRRYLLIPVWTLPRQCLRAVKYTKHILYVCNYTKTIQINCVARAGTITRFAKWNLLCMLTIFLIVRYQHIIFQPYYCSNAKNRYQLPVWKISVRISIFKVFTNAPLEQIVHNLQCLYFLPV